MKKILSPLLLLGLLATQTRAQTHDAPKSLDDTMNYVEISDHLTTSGQIIYDHIGDIKTGGHEVVINLAVADQKRNGEEGFRIIQEGMTYVHIPVSWSEPSLRDLKLFFDVMDANRDRKVFVHCFANMRVSVFVYLYRTLRQGISHEEAWKDVLKVWDPNSQAQWTAFIEKAKVGE